MLRPSVERALQPRAPSDVRVSERSFTADFVNGLTLSAGSRRAPHVSSTLFGGVPPRGLRVSRLVRGLRTGDSLREGEDWIARGDFLPLAYCGAGATPRHFYEAQRS
jgi:hypothetical protein